MPRPAKKSPTSRAKVKNLPKAKELGGKEIRKVKGGVSINWGDGSAKNVASITDGTSNTLMTGEVKKK